MNLDEIKKNFLGRLYVKAGTTVPEKHKNLKVNVQIFSQIY